MRDILLKAFLGNELNKSDIEKFISAINNNTILPVQTGALLGAISAKSGGISANELKYFASTIRNTSNPVNINSKGVIDLCGTGGDCLNTFNISTAVSFIVASLGVKVAKHGARSVSSKSGSADVLEALGINLEIKEENIDSILNDIGMVFLYAPKFNSTMAHIKKIRNELNVPTIFNLLGPLINPVKLDYQVIGVYDETKCELVCNAIKLLGIKEGMVVHSLDGMDELSTTSDNIIYHLKNGVINKYNLPPLSALGLKRAKIEDILGKDSKYNAKIILDILNGKEDEKTDIVLLNSAAALVCANVAKDFIEGVELARNAIKSKKPLEILERLKNVS